MKWRSTKALVWLVMVNIVGGAVVAHGQTSSGASITAQVERPLYFEGETVVLRGRVAGAKVETVSVSDPVGQQCPVRADGSFELKFPEPPLGLHTLALTAKGVSPARVSFYVTSNVRVQFPKFFETDRGYGFGIFCDQPREKMALLPKWAWRLGFDFVAIRAGNGLSYDARFKKTLASTDRLKMTAALVGGDDCGNLEGLAKTVQADGKAHANLNNLLSTTYQRALQTRLTHLVSSLREHESFRYILLIPEQLNLSPAQGYDAENLKRFAQMLRAADPNRTVPSDDDAAGWYTLLQGDKDLWGTWLTFRAELWTDYIAQLRQAVQAVKPDLELGTYGKAPDQGLWNLTSLADHGVTVHAPQADAGAGANDAMSAAADAHKAFGSEPIFLGLPTRFDTVQELQVPMKKLLKALKWGGTRVFVWSDLGLAAESGFYSVVTDEAFNRSTWQKVRPLFKAACRFQLMGLPYKDRFAAYERDGNKLPLEFSIDWIEDGRHLSVKSEDGISAGKPSDSVFAVIQDIQPNGYMEILIVNDAAASSTNADLAVGAGLRARTLNVTIRPGGGLIPFVSDAAVHPLPGKQRLPWLVYERQGDAITVKSLAFQPQQVSLLQLVPSGRTLPHITNSPVGVVFTGVAYSQTVHPQAKHVEKKYRGKMRRFLTVRLTDDPGRDKLVTVHCGGWGKPKGHANCKVRSYDPQTDLAQIWTRGERSDFAFNLFWP